MEKYDPIRIIGEGSFGKVYLMRDKVNRKFVCVKVIKIKNIPKKEREATRMEVDLLKRLHHPNIVRYVDSFLSKNHESLCIAMEYCDGGDLASQVKSARRNLFSENKILHWFVQITLGLHYMHSNKVLHRDLKTQNIFLLGNGRLVLGDLGISKVLEGTMDFAQTCIGTPYYMSPEIFKNKPYSYKSDIWALGCVLYEMTTLNHAFDAQSLNGLAQKIIKGQYPPIHHKYSRYLKELIGEVLSSNPQQRPDTDQILRKPFIKKHIVNFFVDIASRPSQSLGDGTMIVRAAAGGPLAGFGGDVNMISFRNQLKDIGLDDAIQSALNNANNKEKEVVPADANEAKKLAREAASALKREEEHKRIVEAALEKLRVERENRAKERERLVRQQREQAQRQMYQNPGSRKPKVVVGPGIAIGGGRRNPNAPSRPQLNLAPSAAQISNNRRDGPMLSARDRAANNDALPAPQYAMPGPSRASDGRRSIVEEQREKRRAADLAEAEAKRREREAEIKAQNDAREREEAAAKQQKDQLRAQQDAVQRREQQLYLERERQRAAVEQLNKDKLELDRRLAEKERRREERLKEEKAKLDNARAEQLQYYNKPGAGGAAGGGGGGGPSAGADDKESGGASNVSAYERVMARKLEKQQKEEQQYYEQMKAVENDNRAARHMAKDQNKQQIFGGALSEHPGGAVAGGGAGAGVVSSANAPAYAPSYPRANNNRNGGGMEVDELADRLGDAAVNSRFDQGGGGGGGAAAGSNYTPRVGEGDDDDDDDDLDDNDDSVFENNDVPDDLEEEEDMNHKEEELRAELTMATKRCSDLKATLHNTKTLFDQYRADPMNGGTSNAGRPGAAGGATINKALKPSHQAKGLGPIASTIDSEEEEDDDEDRYEEEDEDGSYDAEELPSYSVNVPHNNNANNSNARDARSYVRPIQTGAPPPIRNNVPLPPRDYSNLQDPPSPSGKLVDRIFRLRQKCIENFGRDSFDEAYRFIRGQNEDDDGSDHFQNERHGHVRNIVGDHKAKYIPLIEQLIFMEDTDAN